jgi:hypothetical protein
MPQPPSHTDQIKEAANKSFFYMLWYRHLCTADIETLKSLVLAVRRIAGQGITSEYWLDQQKRLLRRNTSTTEQEFYATELAYLLYYFAIYRDQKEPNAGECHPLEK